jgi:hypothetical protein
MPKLTDHLPRRAWWLIYINPKDHASVLASADPTMLYDTDESPGYRQSMENAFELLFERVPALRKIDARFYKKLHDLAIAHLDLSVSHELISEWSTGAQDEPIVDEHMRTAGSVHFPLTHDPHRTTVAADLQAETIRVAGFDHPVHILVPVTDAEVDRVMLAREGPDFARYACLAAGDQIDVNYRRATAPALVDAVGSRYQEEIAAAGSARHRLAAIARLIRALHVLHLFVNANGRTNITLLLTKLLLDHGFRPVVLADMDDLFSGTYAVADIVDALDDGFTAFDQAKSAELDRQDRDGRIRELATAITAEDERAFVSDSADCVIL